ncbi:class I SAM-dependent methyltransferase [Desulfonatronovibrio magnus]|uniref:class I SAM-dependent methyltransferase n=1 Tax=Desulfonatronovibrio magnus TaxID=698827 RepID=UPI0005EAEDA5|nr:class I SAM-dependent methyltransferase [Desulfonatronovibrio magnus]
MTKLDINCLATINFEVNWKSSQAEHTEKYLARKVNLWRDIFPPGLKEALLDESNSGQVTKEYPPGQAVPARSNSDTIKTNLNHFIRKKFLGKPLEPSPGRFYPRGLLGGVHFFPQDSRPCRIINVNQNELTVDCSHPLTDYHLTISATVENYAPNRSETGGRLSHWAEEILDTGPGMQARMSHGPTDFIRSGFSRVDDSDDAFFYHAPRMVNHIDAQAMEFLAREYARHIRPGMKVLDLMSSVHSHLPLEIDLSVTGLGLNSQEMEANPRLTSHVIHDLNKKPFLHFEDAVFDAVLCSLSVEYLTDPYQVAREAVRVLAPGGTFCIGFSNRWFPPKVTHLWQELHEFERLGLVQDLMLDTGAVGDIKTISIRNWWRPEDDPHTEQTWISDPVYVVTGIKKHVT